MNRSGRRGLASVRGETGWQVIGILVLGVSIGGGGMFLALRKGDSGPESRPSAGPGSREETAEPRNATGSDGTAGSTERESGTGSERAGNGEDRESGGGGGAVVQLPVTFSSSDPWVDPRLPPEDRYRLHFQYWKRLHRDLVAGLERGEPEVWVSDRRGKIEEMLDGMESLLVDRGAGDAEGFAESADRYRRWLRELDRNASPQMVADRLEVTARGIRAFPPGTAYPIEVE